VRLSICIPTYNRAGFLGDLLDSILRDANDDPDLEVVISDNASTDATDQLVQRYRPLFRRLVYFKSANNVGADRNYLKAVELATGEYCWLMGSDDVIESGSLRRVRDTISDNPAVSGITVGRNIYTIDMQLRGRQPLPRGTMTGSRRLEDSDEAYALLAPYFAYLSAQVVSKTWWDRAVASNPVDDFLNAYVHVYVIGKMLQINPDWYYLAETLVGWRGGNDFFLTEGEFYRIKIDIVGFEEITRSLYGMDSKVYKDVMTDVSTGLVFYRLLSAKLRGAPISFMLAAAALVFPSYWRYPQFWMKTAPLFLIPSRALRLARWFRRKHRGTEPAAPL
jgi:abequosyltransferase